ncbi:PadR family transcriptional regulator [Klebsiella pneumoniae]|uniref:PadR family transcriptional regulator n=1 Tax=Klebsiella pneumoniae TaxID=573 RepID=UPI003F762E50
MGSCAAPSAKGDDKFITTDYLQQCLLHGLEKKGYLTSRHERTGRRERRVYDITEQGRTALADAKTKVKELFGELVEGG